MDTAGPGGPAWVRLVGLPLPGLSAERAFGSSAGLVALPVQVWVSICGHLAEKRLACLVGNQFLRSGGLRMLKQRCCHPTGSCLSASRS